MQDNQETGWALAKALIAWIGAVIGSLTLSKLVLFATLVFTSLQTYILVRDKIIRRKACEAKRETP